MKRKLISYSVFENMKNNSTSNAEHELSEAKQLLEKALQIENLTISHFNHDSVVYESNGFFVHANYKLAKNKIVFENIEQLVIDNDSEEANSRKLVSDLVDCLLDENEAIANIKANEVFNNYIKLNSFKRNISESAVPKEKKEKKGKKDKKSKEKLMPFELKAKIKGIKLDVTKDKDSKLDGKKPKTFLKFKTKSEKAKKIKEWASLVENVESYVDYKEFGPLVKESVLSRDSKGNVIALSVPNTQAKNEAKLLSFNWKTLDTDVKVLRSNAKKLAENAEFCKAVAALKRFNAISDTEKIQESLEELVGRFNSVLYLTQNELSSIVAEALQTVNASNYDDSTCDFIAEAILVTAHSNYSERVNKIVNLSGNTIDENSEDVYEDFKNIVDNFYSKLDESNAKEMQVYVDLYESLRTVYSIGVSTNNDYLKQESASHLNDLVAILEQNIEPNLDIAMSAAEWLTHLIETNLDSEGWNVSNNVHITVGGDHPKMSQNAQKGYTPSSDFSGNWKSVAPVSDGTGTKKELSDEMEKNSWGNIGGEDVYPSLDNPYIPKPFGDYKIKGEKNIDNDTDQLAHVGGEDTWPNMTNPYLPKSVDVKMNNGAGTDLVVDK